MSEAEKTLKTLVQKARELAKLQRKLMDAVSANAIRFDQADAAIAAIRADIARVRSEISALVSPVQEAPQA